jgi:hypothetical protein
MRQITPKRSGVVALIAMMFLIVFASLAVGFYATCNSSVIVSSNEAISEVAMSAGESGMDFMRYQMANITMPYGTTPANLMNNTATVLGAAMNGTPNMGASTVSVVGSAINIPSATGWIKLDNKTGAKFRATITQKPATSTLIVTVRGATDQGAMTRAMRMEYNPAARSHSLIGIAAITMSGSAFTDSYNSSKGAYAAATAGHNGSIASNGNIALSNTARVNGDARPGPFHNVTLADSSSVTGLKLPLSAPSTYPSVILPAAGVTNLGDITLSSGVQNVPGGTYLIHNLNLSGSATINWTGPVVLYIQNSYSVSGSVTINTYQNNPKNRVIYFLPTCTAATWSGSNTCVGDLYAPDTNFTVSGSVHKLGRIIAKTINNSSSGGMHADDALPQPGGMDSYEPVASTYEEIK